MDKLTTWTLELAVIDWIAIALLAVGFFVGLNRGLGYAFGVLLWLVAAMFAAGTVAPTLLGWMPNTTDPDNIHAQFMAYGAISGAILSVPLLLRVLGNPFARTKKRADTEPHNKHMGSLVGVLNSVLFATLLVPYIQRLEIIANSYTYALFPAMASRVADNVTFLYPQAFRSQLQKTIGPVGRSEVLKLSHTAPVRILPPLPDPDPEPPQEAEDIPADDEPEGRPH